MQVPSIRPHIVLMAFFLSAQHMFSADGWVETTAPTDLWRALATSADGTRCVAGAYGGGIFVSTNSGGTWNQTSAPVTNWWSVASSADGSNLVAVASNNPLPGPIYYSTNAGLNWLLASAPNAIWFSVAGSADGHVFTAAANQGGIYRSTDSGATWTPTAAPTDRWVSVACSAAGTELIAAKNTPGVPPYSPPTSAIAISTNAGANWTLIDTSPAYWGTVSCSADGTQLMAAGYNLIYVSTNSGATWTSTHVAGTFAGALSADGETVVVGGWPGPIGISTDFGLTWNSNNAPIGDWTFSLSADGNALFAADYGGYGSGGNFHPGGIFTRRFLPKPFLKVAPGTNNLLVSWTIPSIPLVLQQRSDLAGSDWSTVSVAPAFDYTNAAYTMSVSPTNRIGLFRLAQP